MKCPYCGGEFEAIDLRTTDGGVSNVNHCTQCGGFWFESEPTATFLPESVGQYDTAQPNYSLKTFNMMCPIDQTILEEQDNHTPSNGRSWHCNDCRGVFYPRGQLALMSHRQTKAGDSAPPTPGLAGRTQAAVSLSLLGVLAIGVLAVFSRSNLTLSAASATPLPTSGPNILTLVLLALTYLAGTILAVLGRRLPIIIMGWGVILVCLFGFSVLIFGP